MKKLILSLILAFGLLATCLRLGMTIGVAYGVWGAGGITLTALLSTVIYTNPSPP